MGRDALCAQGGEGAAERKEKQRVAAPLWGPGGDYPPRKKRKGMFQDMGALPPCPRKGHDAP